MKIILYIVIIFALVLAFYGLLIAIEYLKYLRRSLSIKFNLKLKKGASKDD